MAESRHASILHPSELASRAKNEPVGDSRLSTMLQLFGNVFVVCGALGAVAAVVSGVDPSFPFGMGVTLCLTLALAAIAGVGWVAVATAKSLLRIEDRLSRMQRQQSML
jgi:hypothetical protein